MTIITPLSPTFPMTPVTPSNITFPWSIGLGLGFHNTSTNGREATAAGQQRNQLQQDIQDDRNIAMAGYTAGADEDAFTAMDIETSHDVNLHDLDIDLGMDIDFDDETVTGVQDMTRNMNDVGDAVDETLGHDVDMTSSTAALAAPSAPSAMDFIDGVFDIDVNESESHNMLISCDQQAGFADSTTVGHDVDLDRILSEIDVGADVNVQVDNDNHMNTNGFSCSDFTALPIEPETIDLFNMLTDDNKGDVLPKNPKNTADDTFLHSIGDEKFLSSLENVGFNPSNLLYSDSLAKPINEAIFPSFETQSSQVDIRQPVSATFSSKSNSSSNSNSTGQKSPEARCHNFTAEKPKYDMRHPWVRVNDTTKGKNNRSGKINQYNPTALYKVRVEPLKNWRSNSYRFKYDQVGELSEPTYSANQIKTYLYNFPTSAERKLKLWIQRAPADSARRYASPESSKCRFRDCPSRRMMNGTIMHGHFRVAFDERWNRYGDQVDPFAAVSGYAHLYCMERFLDFAAVCAKLDVEVDTRSLSKEPRHRWAAGLIGTPECETALSFIKRCRSGQLEPDFPYYPLHEEGSLAGKKHERTLTFAMHNSRYKTLRPKRLREGQSEAPKTSTLYIHFGDVERFCTGRLAERKSQNQVNQSRAASHTPENRLTQQHPLAYTSSNTATQTAAGTLNAQPPSHLPTTIPITTTTAMTSNNPSSQNTYFPSIDAIMKDASAQTDASPTSTPQPQSQPQPPTTISSSPSHHLTDNTTQTNPTTTSSSSSPPSPPPLLPLPPAPSDLKRKRSFHRPEPIRTDLNDVRGRGRGSRASKRPRSNDGTEAINYQNDGDGDGEQQAASRCQGQGESNGVSSFVPSPSPPVAQTLDMDKDLTDMSNVNNMDEPLSAMMRGLMAELHEDGDDGDDEDDEDDGGAVNVPNSGASLGSLFGS